MKLPFSEPSPSGSRRAKSAKAFRELATEVARLRPHAKTITNLEEQDFTPHAKTDKGGYATNFTKGLRHDSDCGLVLNAQDYRHFVEAINSEDRTLFEKQVRTAEDAPDENGKMFFCKSKEKEITWRGWESPRSGHVYELQGPDAGAVGMAPAPRLNSNAKEVAFEMAEVYGLALLRDVPFSKIELGKDDKIDNGGNAEISATTVMNCLNKMHYVKKAEGLDRFEQNRQAARLNDKGKVDLNTLFRGSTDGAKIGPYISQFMLAGSDSRSGDRKAEHGYIEYGSIEVDQRTQTHKQHIDHMIDWASWLDVQNGADFGGLDLFEEKRRFITTPRDLATYVHYDALYEAYLNACLILLGLNIPKSKGFPEPSPSGRRGSFATFGGPHILSLVTEVATRCLKAVRRQKFGFHRRARPEVMGARYTVSRLGGDSALGTAAEAFKGSLAGIDSSILDAVIKHNAKQSKKAGRLLTCPDDVLPLKQSCGINAKTFTENNLLLPMAFPEGSPMHPAYGAGHATVAGGCVTILKAFFEMYQDHDSNAERTLPFAFEPTHDGTKLKSNKKFKNKLTIQNELDKLAANISIGRNMAGVHYYSDYYDSVRMGERIAIGILMEQAPTYGDQIETRFKSFDGDDITISGAAGDCPSMSIINQQGQPTSEYDWWLRHVVGSEFNEDLH